MVADLRASLEDWVQNGKRLEQGVANLIRKALEQALGDRIDWNAERCVSFALNSNRMSIPLAAGEGNLLADVIKIAPDHHDPDGRLRTELIALVRYYQFYKRQTDYPEVDDDLARIANLVQRLMPQALAIVRNVAKARARTAIKLLSTNSRVLGLLDRGLTPQGLSSFLFGEPSPIADLPSDAALQLHQWRQLQDSARAIRAKLTNILLESSGCFQGSGKTAYGVDITRLLENVPADSEKLDMDSLGNIEPGLDAALQPMRDITVGVRARHVLAEARRLQQVLDSDLGDNFDKNQVADALKELADNMQGVWSTDELGMSSTAFKRLTEEFRGSRLKEALTTLQQAAAQVEGDKVDGKALSRIAQLDVNPLITAHRFVLIARKVISAAKRRADNLYGVTKDLDVGAEANKIRASFDSVLGDMDVLEAKGEQACC